MSVATPRIARRDRPVVRRTAAAIAASAVVAAAALPAGAYPRPGRVERVSMAPDGAEPNGESFMAAPTPDGRHVAFQSGASNLVPGDTNDRGDIFVLDRERRTIDRVSVASDGTQADAGSASPSISADGRYVAFSSFATNLVPGGTSLARPDIFVHDRETGTTERVSVSSAGVETDRASWEPSISADGRFVAFESWATNLVPGDTNDAYDIFVRDRVVGTTERVSVASDGTQGNSSSQYPDVTADGRYVAFQSRSRTLVLGDVNNADDIFVHDRVARTTERVSVGPDGAEPNQPSYNPSITDDGRYVAFESWAFNLVPGDLNRAPDVFVADRQAWTVTRVSVSSDGAEGSVNGHSVRPAIAAGGRQVAFHSAASGLVAGDTNATWDVFVHDLPMGTTERVSVSSDGVQGGGASRYPAIVADGTQVLFESLSANLVSGKTGEGSDILVRHRGPATGVGGLEARSAAGGGIEVSGWATFSGVAVSSAGDLPDVPVAPAGADIVGASVIHRPEPEDLVLRLRLASMPGLVVGGAPGMVYRWSFRAGDTRYEVRAMRVAATAEPSADAFIALYECAPACGAATRLSGGIGVVGPEVRATVPLEAVGLAGGGTLASVEASAGPGEASPGPLLALDAVNLPDATLSAPRVDLGVAPAGASEQDVAYTREATLTEGRFSGTLDVASLGPGDHRVWARACLGETCGTAWTPIAAG
ncbi:MAG: hypothetical protein M3245_04135 [Actinomycetota bacterium]|nr:hypothetical protein [Actinomycetota bacterium]